MDFPSPDSCIMGRRLDSRWTSEPTSVGLVHERAVANPFLQRFTLLNRILLAVAFLPTGLVKISGERFTTLGLESPVGFFFEAMYRSGIYWRFLGAMQILAAILLLGRRTSLFGALLFLPIAVNIFLITLGVGFTGTVWVAGGLVLSALYLVAWDADRVVPAARTLLAGGRPFLPPGMGGLEAIGWVLGAGSTLGFFMWARGLAFGGGGVYMGMAFLGAVLVLVGWRWGRRSDDAGAGG